MIQQNDRSNCHLAQIDFSKMLLYVAVFVGLSFLSVSSNSALAQTSTGDVTVGQTRSKDDNNVILGRDLLSTTRRLEELGQIRLNLLELQQRLSQSEDPMVSLQLQQQLSMVNNLTSRITILKSDLEIIQEQIRNLDSETIPVPPKPVREEPSAEPEVPAEPALGETAPMPPPPMTDPNDSAEPSAVPATAPMETTQPDASATRELSDIEESLSRVRDEVESISYKVNDFKSSTEELVNNSKSRDQRVRSTLGQIRSASSYAEMLAASAFSNSDKFVDRVPFFSEYETLSRAPRYLDQQALRNNRLSSIQDAIQEVDDLKNNLLDIENDSATAKAQLETLTKFETRISENIAAGNSQVQQTLESVNKAAALLHLKQQELEDALEARDANLSQLQINTYLVWAVFGMILTIPLLFVFIRSFPPNVTRSIIENRVIIEILSMGFLLVTVIILGSAKLIQGEGLSGLLGTVAGYIFTRKAAEMYSEGLAKQKHDKEKTALRKFNRIKAKLEKEIKDLEGKPENDRSQEEKDKVAKLKSDLEEHNKKKPNSN